MKKKKQIVYDDEEYRGKDIQNICWKKLVKI